MDIHQTIRSLQAERAVQSFSAQEYIRTLVSLVTGGNLARKAEVCTDRDFHLFFDVANSPAKVVHIQIYPGFCNDNSVCLRGRVMEPSRMQEIRQRGEVSRGNEHEAVLFELPSLAMNIPQSWQPEQLLQKIVADLKGLGVLED